MRIGELAERTGTSRRLLRYYEEQGLIGAKRFPNGYREYDESFVDKVRQIRDLLGIGLSTKVIRQLLPCLDSPRQIYVADATPETVATLEREHEKMGERIRTLERNRDAIAEYLELVRRMRSQPEGRRGREDGGADVTIAGERGAGEPDARDSRGAVPAAARG